MQHTNDTHASRYGLRRRKLINYSDTVRRARKVGSSTCSTPGGSHPAIPNPETMPAIPQAFQPEVGAISDAGTSGDGHSDEPELGSEGGRSSDSGSEEGEGSRTSLPDVTLAADIADVSSVLVSDYTSDDSASSGTNAADVNHNVNTDKLNQSSPVAEASNSNHIGVAHPPVTPSTSLTNNTHSTYVHDDTSAWDTPALTNADTTATTLGPITPLSALVHYPSSSPSAPEGGASRSPSPRKSVPQSPSPLHHAAPQTAQPLL